MAIFASAISASMGRPRSSMNADAGRVAGAEQLAGGGALGAVGVAGADGDA
jgi:hypothetical protein